jgi:predicted SnoaL-like aldol condensation-catalyzing enzyme
MRMVVAFFTKVLKVKRTDKCDRLTTELVVVIADDYTTWFDTWWFVEGKADEHWDPATIAPPAAK